jgi:hypothetical protein
MFGFFVNDNKNVDVKYPKTQIKKCLIIYNITNGITTLKKYVNVYHSIVAKMFEEEINSPSGKINTQER